MENETRLSQMGTPFARSRLRGGKGRNVQTVSMANGYANIPNIPEILVGVDSVVVIESVNVVSMADAHPRQC